VAVVAFLVEIMEKCRGIGASYAVCFPPVPGHAATSESSGMLDIGRAGLPTYYAWGRVDS